MQRLYSKVRKALADYQMIRPGDRICVGVSGGKDSLALLAALAGLRRFYPASYTLQAVTLDLGLPGMDFSPVADWCRQLEVSYTIKKTNIKEVVFDLRQESNPCSLCAKLRRGSLHNAALALDCNVVALGHHRDDVVETFLLSLLYEGRLSCFSPVTELSRKQLRVIRPLLYLQEGELRGLAARQGFPVVASTCPADLNSKRFEMKDRIRRLEAEFPGFRTRTFGAVKQGLFPPESSRSTPENAKKSEKK